jgi:hypothetical protein
VDVPVFTVPQRGRDGDFRAAARETRQGARHSEERSQSKLRAQKEHCARLMEFRSVDFWFWGRFLWDALWHAVFAIASQQWVEQVCVGVTTDVRWRWAGCEGHNGMVPHRDNYNVIYPLSCAFGRAASAMERLLQSKLRAMLPAVCVHTGYKRGVVRENSNSNVLYCCVKHRSWFCARFSGHKCGHMLCFLLSLIEVWFAHDANYKTKPNATVILTHFADVL